MSYISGIRPQAVEAPGENASWYGEGASEPRIYAYVQNDPLNRTDPLGLCDNPQGCGGSSSNQLIASTTGAGSGLPTQTTSTTTASTTVTVSELSQLGSQNPPSALSAQPSTSAIISQEAAAIGLPAQSSSDSTIQLAASADDPQGLKAFNSVVRILQLTPSQAQQLHMEITKQGMTYQEILQTGKDMFGK